MDKEALNMVAQQLGIYPSWLQNLITFESGGWNPAARNPYTGARGLIQFMPDTAKSLGYKDADDLYNQNPTDTAQLLGPVLKYLSQYAPFPTEQSLYMAVFYPKARNVPVDTAFQSLMTPEKFDIFHKQNPNILTVNDYVSKVNHAPIIKTAIDIAGIALIVGASFLSYQYIIKPYLQKEVTKWQSKTTAMPQMKVVSPENV